MLVERILNAFVVLFVFSSFSVGSEIRSAVIDNESSQLTVVNGYREDFIAWANFTDAIKTTGWVWWANCFYVSFRELYVENNNNL